ncbi:hypothetical protein ZIOFF_018568 [Zingiber officinale]|uniref:Uncharacterized protein n=1 Tax=Zingiber officinale TaxID=94328 RepID=A0A8J5H8E6_ZINOF|nr:hypothetical protein ZIOFF_018568 [Zingiber officinale]
MNFQTMKHSYLLFIPLHEHFSQQTLLVMLLSSISLHNPSSLHRSMLFPSFIDALKDSLKDEKVGTLLDFLYSLLSGYHPLDQGIKLLSLVGTLLDFWYSWFFGYCPPDQGIKLLSPSGHYWTSGILGFLVIILPTKESNFFLGTLLDFWYSWLSHYYPPDIGIELLSTAGTLLICCIGILLDFCEMTAPGSFHLPIFSRKCIEPYAIASPRLNDHSGQKSTSDGNPSMPDDNIKSSMRRLSILQSSETNSKETKSLLGRLFE